MLDHQVGAVDARVGVWGKGLSRDEKDRVIVLAQRVWVEIAIEAPEGSAARSGPSGRRRSDKSTAALEMNELFLQARLPSESGLIRQVVERRAGAMPCGGDEPEIRSAGCGRNPAAARAAGIGEGIR